MKTVSRDIRGWMSVIACSAGIFWSGALIFGFPGVMGEYWRETFQVGVAATSKTVMFVLFALGFFSFFCGKFHLKHGTRVCFSIGTAVIFVSMIILLFAKNIYMVYVWAFLNGASVMFIYSPGLATVQRWFPQKKGFVSGLVNLLFGISAAIMSPIFKAMLSNWGYTKMYITIIILILVVNLIATYFCEMPEFANLSDAQRAEHEQLLEDIKQKSVASGQKAAEPMKPGEAAKTLPFWCMCVIWALMGAAGISMVTLSTGYAAAIGLTGGVTILTTYNITNGLSRIVAGMLSDKIGGRATGCIAFILAAVGYFGMNAVDSFLALAILAACVGYGFGTLFAISAPMITDIYGITYFGMIFGLVFMSYGFLGGILGPNLYGMILQATGSYSVVFTYLGIFAVVSAVLILLVKPIKQRGK